MSKKIPGPTPFQRRMARGNPRLHEEIHDPYRSTAKQRTPGACAQCGATYRGGRWTWEKLRPAPPATLLCPACHRINDRYPAGEIHIGGAFGVAHAAEAIRIARNVEAAESAEHPLHRIMEVRRAPDGVTITTTDVHLPRRIGHALEAAWQGALKTHYDEEGYYARVGWERAE
jgi:hypothetical protein